MDSEATKNIDRDYLNPFNPGGIYAYEILGKEALKVFLKDDFEKLGLDSNEVIEKLVNGYELKNIEPSLEAKLKDVNSFISMYESHLYDNESVSIKLESIDINKKEIKDFTNDKSMNEKDELKEIQDNFMNLNEF